MSNYKESKNKLRDIFYVFLAFLLMVIFYLSLKSNFAMLILASLSSTSLLIYSFYLRQKYRSSSYFLLKKYDIEEHKTALVMIGLSILHIYVLCFIIKNEELFIISTCFIFSLYAMYRIFQFRKSIVFEYDGQSIRSIQNLAITIRETDKMLVVSHQSMKVMDFNQDIQENYDLDIRPNDVRIFMAWVNDQLKGNQILFFDTSEGEAIPIDANFIELRV